MQSRNESRDIWSLGCVFLEICSVLADHTNEEMSHFFKNNGTHGEYIRENSAGATAWAEYLKSNFAIPQDQQPLELALRMCTVEPQKRPLAKELLAIIFGFDSPPRYYGLCCDDQKYSNERSNDMTIDAASFPEEVDLLKIDQGLDRDQAAQKILQAQSRYLPPAIDDPTEETTVRAFFPPTGIAKKHIIEDADEPTESFDAAANRREPTDQPVVLLDSLRSPRGASLPERSLTTSLRLLNSHKSSIRDTPHKNGILSVLRNLELTQLPCPWPTCSRQLRFYGRDALVAYIREIHDTYELFWTSLIRGPRLVSPTQTPELWVPGQIISDSDTSQHPPIRKDFVLKRLDTQIIPSPDSAYSFQEQDPKPTTRRYSSNEKTNVVHPGTTTPTDRSRHKSFAIQDTPGKSNSNSVTFSLLPEDRRPEPIKSKLKDPEFDAQEEPIFSLELLPEPLISSDPKRNIDPQLSIPRSSLVPSYFLAMTNRMSPDTLNGKLAFTARAQRPPPLFLYGSLMFPSVLRAQAERFISLEGVYSRKLQRRLSTSPEDWVSANESLQQAAQQMTPALLKGYQRFEIQESGDAGLVSAKSANARLSARETLAGDVMNERLKDM